MKYLFICLTVALTASAGMITPRLVDQMETARADAMIDIFVKPAGDVDCGYVAQATAGFSRADRREFAVSVMKAVAEQTQAPILESLKAWPSESVTGLHTNWLANFISCSATPDAIRDIAEPRLRRVGRLQAGHLPVHRTHRRPAGEHGRALQG